MNTRFIVTLQRGMCMGAGMFVVVDTVTGREASHPFYDKGEAERVALRLNVQEAA